MELIATCSNRPRPSVQKGAKGSQYWRKEMFHMRYADQKRTLCSCDANDWLTMDGMSAADALENPYLCGSCKRQLRKIAA